MKKKLIFLVSLIIFIIALYFGYIFYLSWLMRKNIEASKESILKVELSCADGTIEKLQRWSKAGYSRGCYKNGLRHGKWIAWEGGYLHIAGSYRNGNHDGQWKFFNKDGTIYRIIQYDNGKEITNEIIQKKQHSIK